MIREGKSDGGGRRKAVLISVIVVALGAAAAIQWKSLRDERIQPVTRRTFDFEVTWRCLECKHTIQDNAAVGPKPCPKCGKDAMYASLRWSCPKHGGFDFWFQYDENGKPLEVKYDGRDWIPAFDENRGWNVKCPKCGGGMNPG